MKADNILAQDRHMPVCTIDPPLNGYTVLEVLEQKTNKSGQRLFLRRTRPMLHKFSPPIVEQPVKYK